MRFGKFALVVGVGLLVAGLAPAQGPGGFVPGGFGGGLAGMIGQNKQLQEELKVSKDQADKLTEAVAKVREDLRDDLAKLRERDTTPQEREKIMKKMTDANAKAVDSVLKPEQVKRLHQIENQQAGIGLFSKEEVQTALKLSDKQKDQIDEITKGLQKDMRDLFGGGRGGPGRGGFEKMQELQKKAMDDVRKILNDKQKETIKDLTGEPFELRFEGGFPGGPGGPGGRGPGGFGGFAQPGQILAPFVQDQLKLTADQKKKLEELQKDVDGKLDKILTDDQKKQLKDMRPGPGRGGPGGPPGGGPGGPPERPE